MRQIIGVVGVQHGAISDRYRQIKRPATPYILVHDEGLNFAACVKGGSVFQTEIVAFSSDNHIVIAVVTHFAGAAR